MADSRNAAALRRELERRILADIQEFERASGERVVDLKPQTFEHGQTGKKLVGVDAIIGEGRKPA